MSIIKDALAYLIDLGGERSKPAFADVPGNPDLVASVLPGREPRFFTRDRSTFTQLTSPLAIADWITGQSMQGAEFLEVAVCDSSVNLRAMVKREFENPRDPMSESHPKVYRTIGTAGLVIDWSAPYVVAKALVFAPDCPVKRIAQREIIELMRRSFAGCQINRDLITAFRIVDFARQEQATSQIARGREQLGKSVEAAVQNVDALPEAFTATIQPTNSFSTTPVTIKINVDALPAEQVFAVWVSESEFKAFTRAAVEQVFEQVAKIVSADCPDDLPYVVIRGERHSDLKAT